MCAIITLVVWTTSGTFMLMFLAALQNMPVELDEASLLDGAIRWQHLRFVTLPLLKPTMFLVLTLGLIGTWQVFDQIYVMSQGNPAKTTLTPALPVLPDGLPGLRLRLRRGDLVRAVPDHHRADAAAAVGACGTGRSAPDRGGDARHDRGRPSEPDHASTYPSPRPRRRPRGPRPRRRPARRVATRIVGYAILIFFALVFIYPFVIQLASSFKTEPDAAANPLSPVPDPLTTDSFERIFDGTDFPPGWSTRSW